MHKNNSRKRILIVNAFIDEYRRAHGSPQRIPRAMGPPYLAGAFDPNHCDVRLYNEQYSGPLTNLDLLVWADMLVLTGVNTSFDRMKQLTAYARTLNEAIVVVAGGPAIRALPKHSKRFFDFACTGDIEQLGEVARTVFGPHYAAQEVFPRYDLSYGGGLIGYVESSRNCNFHCSFCSLTGEGERYKTYDLDFVRRQILATGKKQIVFIDNNFYGNSRDYFRAKLDMCKELIRQGKIKRWACLVTGDFFARPENLELARDAGCNLIFSGVESFDKSTILSVKKRQNTIVPQIEMIKSCLESGIAFAYGIMLDPSSRPIDELNAEIEFILSKPEISLPSFFTLSIPLLGTPYFNECLRDQLFFPNTRLRDLDGTALTMQPLDSLEDTLEFVRNLPMLRGYRRRVLAHTVKFLRRYCGTLDALQIGGNLLNALLISTESFGSSPTHISLKTTRRTYFAPTEELDPFYSPMISIDKRYEDYFRPTFVTDHSGALHSEMKDDLAQVTAGQEFSTYPLKGYA